MIKRWLPCLLLLCVGSAVAAGSIHISPVHLTLGPNQSTAVLRVKNNTGASTVMQLSAYAWSQHDGQSQLNSTRAILATPPIYRVAAGSKQVVRVGVRGARDPHQEKAYRLIMTQVPSKSSSDQSSSNQQGIKIALRFSIPVFVEPGDGKSAPKLEWQLDRRQQGRVRVSVQNTGTAHAQLSKLSLSTSAQGSALAQVNLGPGYLLPDTRRSWTLNLERPIPPDQKLVVHAQTQSGVINQSFGADP